MKLEPSLVTSQAFFFSFLFVSFETASIRHLVLAFNCLRWFKKFWNRLNEDSSDFRR